jgi:hypothetical protein
MLEPDPKEPTLEEVLRTEAGQRHDTPVPLGPPAATDRGDDAPRSRTGSRVPLESDGGICR